MIGFSSDNQRSTKDPRLTTMNQRHTPNCNLLHNSSSMNFATLGCLCQPTFQNSYCAPRFLLSAKNEHNVYSYIVLLLLLVC